MTTLLDLVEPDLSRLCPLAKKVAEVFLSRPNEWIDMHELARVGGTGGWSVRVREVRRLAGLNLENRQYTRDGYRVSEYRWVR